MQRQNDVYTENKLKFHVFQDERFVDLNLYQYGWERTEPLHAYGPHKRDHYLFHFVISGKGTLYSNDTAYRIDRGHGFLILPDQTTTYVADEEDPWEYTWIEFDGLRVSESISLAGLSAAQPVYTPQNHEAGRLLQEQMMYIVNHPQDSPVRQIGQGFLFLDQLVQSSAARRLPSQRRLRDFYMKEALSFIEQNYQRDISIEEIAAFCGLNRSYFGKVFRDSMGESPQAFLLHYRMARAAQMLKETTLPIGTISTMVSYANQLHFSRAFKSVYGMAPRTYRQAHFIRTEEKDGGTGK
ncbi:AraC family transcriptional regulator [uncultured Subdoligranulum sp.]|uniref:AraC family transcriptional regulator n=1 Tax=uncultured Subdoligranulum sp. TaxID=512298 RepID=UPI0026169100|nr:AraC family transcriptional regulator [uncultured Subdoligranulum sp.]